MSTFRTIVSSAALSLSVVLAASASFAGEKGGPEKLSFPVAGAAFKQRVEARLDKQKTHIEERIASKQIPADKVDEARTRYAERRAKVLAAVEAAVADGTVTADEAKAVRAAGGGQGCKHGEKKGQDALAADRAASVLSGIDASAGPTAVSAARVRTRRRRRRTRSRRTPAATRGAASRARERTPRIDQAAVGARLR